MYKPLPVNDTVRSFYNVIRPFALEPEHLCSTTSRSPTRPISRSMKRDGQGWPGSAPVGTLSNKHRRDSEGILRDDVVDERCTRANADDRARDYVLYDSERGTIGS